MVTSGGFEVVELEPEASSKSLKKANPAKRLGLIVLSPLACLMTFKLSGPEAVGLSLLLRCSRRHLNHKGLLLKADGNDSMQALQRRQLNMKTMATA